MENFLQGKNALVTGGSRGIGRAVAAALLRAGASVAICGRAKQTLDTAVKELKGESRGAVIGKVADICSVGDVKAVFELVDEQLGGLDILVNNAGIGVFQTVAEMSVEEWRRTIETNLTGAFLCSREAIPRFRNRGAGFIINISSLAGKNPFKTGAAYNASKFGLNGFSEAMMLDHRYDNVRVCYVMPGSVDTEFSPRAENKKTEWKIAAEDIGEIVLGVLRMPERTLISRVEVRPTKPAK
jgi:3-oxoacyl-[acyl-carrier protein] reductase